jgi:hypothetical protein
MAERPTLNETDARRPTARIKTMLKDVIEQARPD